jgi:hypothetical protein
MTSSGDLRLTDARLILAKWYTEQTPLVCIASLFNLSFSVHGIVSSFTDEQFAMTPKSGEAKLTLRLDDPELVFLYAERRELSDAGELDEDSASLSGLTIALPARIPMRLPLPDVPPKRESVTIIELSR